MSSIFENRPQGATAPPHWQFIPLKYLFRRLKTLGSGQERLLSIYREYGVIPKDSRDDNFNKASDDLSKYQLVFQGDLVVNKMKAWQGSVAVSEYDGIISPAYFVYRPVGAIDNRFAHYLLRSNEYFQYYASISSGVRLNQWDLDPRAFERLKVAFPPLEEQRQIADYLDRELTEIDSFVADCSRMVELIEEKESAFTASLLTHGLTDSDSVAENHGIPWLENESIPTHWHRMKLGFLLRMKSGDAISSEAVQEEGLYPVFGGGGLRGYTSTSNITGIHVLIGRQGALCGKVFVSREEAFATEHAIVTYPKIILDLRWLESLLRFMNLGQYSQSAAQPGIGVETLSKLYVPVPPLSEQVEIGDSIAKHQESRSDLLLELESAIALAHERRAALISAAVTGHIDVSSQGLSPASQLRNELEVHV